MIIKYQRQQTKQLGSSSLLRPQIELPRHQVVNVTSKCGLPALMSLTSLLILSLLSTSCHFDKVSSAQLKARSPREFDYTKLSDINYKKDDSLLAEVDKDVTVSDASNHKIKRETEELAPITTTEFISAETSTIDSIESFTIINPSTTTNSVSSHSGKIITDKQQDHELPDELSELKAPAISAATDKRQDADDQYLGDHRDDVNNTTEHYKQGYDLTRDPTKVSEITKGQNATETPIGPSVVEHKPTALRTDRLSIHEEELSFKSKSTDEHELVDKSAAKLIADSAHNVDTQRDSIAIKLNENLKVIPSEALGSDVESTPAFKATRPKDKQKLNITQIIEVLFKKKPYAKLMTAEQKWDDAFKKLMSIQDSVKDLLIKGLLKDAEYYSDISVSPACSEDLKFVQTYAKKSTNFRWLLHMFDATGKNEPGMLTGNLASLGHPVQCINVRAPARPSNDTFDERFFEKQTELLGEKFRGKYCLASFRPVLKEKPPSVSRFSHILDGSLLSNISFMGLPVNELKALLHMTSIPDEKISNSIDRSRPRLDQVPFESELFEYLIQQRNFMYSLPRFMGVCYPSSCTKEDVRITLQKTMDDEHQVVDIEYDCEQEEKSTWNWLITPRLIAFVLLGLFVGISLGASITRYIIVDKLRIKRSRLPEGSNLSNLIGVLDLMSMDKCAGILFVKTKEASPLVNQEKFENHRSTSIDALKGLLILCLVYSELVYLGCLPIPFMWSKWADAMFPFYRSWFTQIFLNTQIWTQAFYIISAYLIALKFLENSRPKFDDTRLYRAPGFAAFASSRYVRLIAPLVPFILLNYIWPRLSNGFVMQDQTNKILKACDNYGWTNMLLFHNYNPMNETCLWPSHVSATFFQLHLLSYPILVLMLASLRTNMDAVGVRKIMSKILQYSGLTFAVGLAAVGLVYPALVASSQRLIVPFLIDYIDYDNYQHVIEWMVLPTYNHLAAYMMGLIMAFHVVRKRMKIESQKASASQFIGCYLHREASFDSMSSSIQSIDMKATSNIRGKFNLSPNTNSFISQNERSLVEYEQNSSHWFTSGLASGFFVVLLVVSLTVTWFWNGLGQPMTSNQTFWFVCFDKLLFCIAFSYLFMKHFATRKNSSNPWMLTRFLVPIGRMSLTVFYTSWLVIWFDLLASLYQWHPSHYFVCEKFNEIIFITLIIAMLVYGSFEGMIKNIQYAQRMALLKPSHEENSKTRSEVQGIEALRRMRSPFERLFESHLRPEDVIDMDLSAADKSSKTPISGDTFHNQDNDMSRSQVNDKLPIIGQNSECHNNRSGDRQASGKTLLMPSSGHNRKRLSAADQCTLNAELRANYSFASIGLYESAGATGDLHATSQQRSPPTQKLR